MKYYKPSKEKGFTLIELMVSISIFTMIAIVALGAIVTIVDANRKARSLSSIMNNLNFSVESMTRSIKTGEQLKKFPDQKKVSVHAIDFNGSVPGDFPRIWVTYKHEGEAIVRCQSQTEGVEENCYAITSSQIDVQDVKFIVVGESPDDKIQPRVRILIKGKTIPEIRGTNSTFSIQTTVSQRKLDRTNP